MAKHPTRTDNLDSSGENRLHDQLLFWGCFLALVTTAFGFIARMFLIDTWATEFNLDAPQAGRLAGIGVWPFAVSIIGFSLIIDKIGYKVAMVIAFLGHITWAVMGVSAFFVSKGGNSDLAFSLLYWGSLILALGNGTVEAFINPVVATMFSKEKTKWLNILHAGWPGGLVVAGIITIFIDFVPWWVKIGLIAVPAIAYFLILLPIKFPVQERVASGVSYKEMLSEFGVFGATVVAFLITLQLMDFYSNGNTVPLSTTEKGVFIGIGLAIVFAFWLYTRSMGRLLMLVLILIMMPLATTEIGTDGWITGIMEGVAAGKFHPGWVLVYTSVIMMVLRFFAGPIVHALSPLGLLAASALLAIIGLYTLSFATAATVFVAATVYGFGKTFFWPTMLGVVAEQMPKGGALTLNAISGIGMLAVGTLGFPYIGALQAEKENQAIANSVELAQEIPGLVKNGELTVVEDRSVYEIIQYKNISNKKLNKLIYSSTMGDDMQTVIETVTAGEFEKIVNRAPTDEWKELQAKLPADLQAEVEATQEIVQQVKQIRSKSSQGALANMVIFPAIMLGGYILLMLYFKSKGGYKAVDLGPAGDVTGSHKVEHADEAIADGSKGPGGG